MTTMLMEWIAAHRLDLWTVVVGVLANCACALLGCFLVLRRMSLLGDAISHAILPGLALSFILTGSRDALPMLAGAMAVGVLTAFLTQTLHRFARVSEDTSMGVVFTTLFAAGVILISQVRAVDLDPGCVLYGLIEFTALDTVPTPLGEVPRAALTLAAVLLFDLCFVAILWKELKLASFDPALATTLGLSAGLVHYILMAVVAGTAVAAFEAVGSILVIAMLIAPGAAAHLLTDRLGRMVAIALAIGASSAVFGYWAAARFNTSAAGAMAVAAGAHYFLAVLAAPRHGLVSRGFHRLLMALRIVREDVLALLYRWGEARGDVPLPKHDVHAALGGGPVARLALWVLLRRGRILAEGGGLKLSERGKRRARDLVRSHRLWEAYLAKHLGIALDHVHAPAERMEHYITPQISEALEKQLAGTDKDPHGKPIPGVASDEG